MLKDALLLQDYFWGLSITSNPSVAETVFRDIFNLDLSGFYSYHPFGHKIALDYEERGIAFNFSSSPNFDREDFTIFDDGSILVEHIEYYQEYWFADANGWFNDSDDSIFDWHNSPPESDIDRVEHWNYGAMVNSLCYFAWYKNLEDFLKENEPMFQVLPPFEWAVITPHPLQKFIPRYCIRAWSVRSLEEIPKTQNILGYGFWLRAYKKRFYAEPIDVLHNATHEFDVYYPLNLKEKKYIKVLVVKEEKIAIVKWKHGKHGLFAEICNQYDTESIIFKNKSNL